jgi:hypothetical protein
MRERREETVCRSVRQVEETHPIESDRGAGEIRAVNVFKIFPPSKPGAVGFTRPGAPPGTTDFRAWFDYFVQRIGAAVEQLNAWQFNLLEGAKPNEAEFAAELDALARDMGIGQPGSHNPTRLVWPLSGVYVCDLLLTGAPKSEDKRVLLVTAFEMNAEYQVVTNCSVVLIEPTPQGGDTPGTLPPIVNWKSSSSSSLATSSSSTPP